MNIIWQIITNKLRQNLHTEIDAVIVLKIFCFNWHLKEEGA